MFDIAAEGLTLTEPIDSVVRKLEDKHCRGPKKAAYLYGRLLGTYAMMKRVYHGFDRRMKTSSVLNAGRRCPKNWLGSEELKKAQVYIDRANARSLTNYRCFENQFKNLLSQLGDWNPVRLTHEENSLILRGWFHQNLFNDKMDDYIRLKNKSKYKDVEPVAASPAAELIESELEPAAAE